MANIRKKVINTWDGGIKTSNRSNDPDTSIGAQMVKGFDIHRDSKELVPIPSWTDFTTESEKGYGIRAMGGVSDTVFGVGKGLSNWFGASWSKRIRIDINDGYHLATGIPLRLDMSLLPNEFWSGINSDASDVRATKDDGVTQKSLYIENLDTTAKTGDLWIPADICDAGTPTFAPRISITGTGSGIDLRNTAVSQYASAFPLTLTGETFNHLTINLKRVGSPSDLRVYIYSDNAGVPDVLVANLGTINVGLIFTVIKDVRLYFADQTLTGSYHLILSSATADESNYYEISYSGSGTETVRVATDSGLTTWSSLDTTATPYYILEYFSNPVVDKHFYLYYENQDESETPYGTPTTDYLHGGRNVFTGTSMRWAYTFGDDTTSNRYYGNSSLSSGDTEAFKTDPAFFTDGLFGRAIRTANSSIETDNDDDVGISGNDLSLSFTLYCTTLENKTLVEDTLGYWSVKLNTSGNIVVEISGSIGTTICTSALAISLNEEHVIDVSFNDDTVIYIDGVKELFTLADGNADAISTNAAVRVNSGQYCTLGQIWGFNDDLSEYQVRTKYNNFKRSTFFIVGSEEDKSSVNLQYSGVQLYTKSITSGDWSEKTEAGSPVKSLNYFPLNGFVDDSGSYFPVSLIENDIDSFLYLAKVSNTDVITPDFLPLGFGVSTNKIAIQKEVPIDGVMYFNDTGSVLNSASSDSEYTNLAPIQSIAGWKTYLGIGGNSRGQGYMTIWDLSSSLATDKVRVGTGNLRIVGNASDELFVVVDNFIDDEILSSGMPTMEIKQYVGNGKVQTTHIVKIPAIITASSYEDEWEQAVSNFKIIRNFQTLFYARLPKDETGVTFNEGLWSVGLNTEGQLALTLQIPTDGLGMPENIFGFAQQVFFIKKDGGIVRLSNNTYNNISLYTTLKMNEGNTEVEKKLHGIEIVTEPLDEGQTVSVYFKKNSDTTRTKICELTGEGEISREATYDDNEDNLPHYQEIEFDIESTGGKAAVLEFNYRYEYLSDVI